MMKSFCAASNLRTFVQRAQCLDVIAECEFMLESMYGQDTRGTLMNDIRVLHSSINNTPVDDDVSNCDYNEVKLRTLDDETYRALVAFAANNKNDGWTPRNEVLLHAQHTITGLQYQRSTSGKKNSVIFFQPKAGEHLVPGVIREIFSIPRANPNGTQTRCVLLAVQRYKQLGDHIHDPFKKFEAFGAGLWRECTEKMEIVRPSQKVCHAVRRKWGDNILVMKPLNRVSHPVYNHYAQR
jgi:hypothetical protein